MIIIGNDILTEENKGQDQNSNKDADQNKYDEFQNQEDFSGQSDNKDKFSHLFEEKENEDNESQVLEQFAERHSQTENNQPIEEHISPKHNLLNTGIPGFDQLIEKGGIPRGVSVLLSGGPGSGKTTFSLQTLNHGASNGEKCLYLSFEESEGRLISHMENFGWNPKKLQEDGLLIIKRMDPFDISRSVEALLAKARGELLIELDEIEGLIPPGFNPDRIVLDSLSAVAAAFAGREEGYRIYIEQLFKALEKVGATTFLITEVNQDTGAYSRSGVEEFLSDGVVAFYNMRKGNIRVSATEIIKLRGVSHKKKIVPFDISSGKGIEVYPTEEIFTNQ